MLGLLSNRRSSFLGLRIIGADLIIDLAVGFHDWVGQCGRILFNTLAIGLMGGDVKF